MRFQCNRELFWFCFTKPYHCFKKTRATYLTNQIENQSHPRLGQVRVPALNDNYVYFL